LEDIRNIPASVDGCVFPVRVYNKPPPIPGPEATTMTTQTRQTDKKYLRTIAHSLSPVVTLAQKGLTENVSRELERALNEHELIKVKIFAADRDARREITQEILESTSAELIQSIGNVAVLYRAAEKPDPRLSNLLRFKSA
jgi:RNA-binding protein